MPFEPTFGVPETLYEGLVASGATSADRVAKLSDVGGGGLSADEVDAIQNAVAPDATNVFMTKNDLGARILTPVNTTAALAALDAGGVLPEGVSCLVLNRGDGYSWRYKYVPGAGPTLDLGVIGGVDIFPIGTNGYWVPEDFAAYLLLASEFDAQRLGDLSAAVTGSIHAGAAWFLSSEADDANGLGFTLDWDGGRPEQVKVTSALKALATSTSLTCTVLNAAIANLSNATNKRARIVFSAERNAYLLVWPPDVEHASVAITAPTVGTDLSVDGKLGLTTTATAAGYFTPRIERSSLDLATRHIGIIPEQNGFAQYATTQLAPSMLLQIDATAANAAIPIFDATHPCPFPFRVVNMWCICSAANAGGTVQVLGDSGNPISDAMPMSVLDEVGYPGTIDTTYTDIAEGDDLSLLKNAAGDKGVVYIEIVRKARA